MNLHRRRSGNRDAWGRVFALLIIVVIALFFVDQYIGLDGILQRREPSATTQPTQTATLPIFFATAEEYSFVPATEIPATATPSPMPTLTPTPYIPMEYTEISDEEDIDRIDPFSIIALCEEPYKSSRYVVYDPNTGAYRALTDSIPYLVEPQDAFTTALYDGVIQRDFALDFLSDFPFPLQWRTDMQYAVLAVAANEDAVVVHHWASEEESLYWLSRGSDTAIELLALPNSIEDSYVDANNEWLFLRLLNDEGKSDLYAVDLMNGGLMPLTEFQSVSAYGGALSWDGINFAYWTNEGVWGIKLDGSFGALIFPDGQQPSWSPDGEHLVMVKDDQLVIGSASSTQTNLVRLPVSGNQPVWSADGSTILYWQSDGEDCTLNFWNVNGNYEQEVFRTQNQICQSQDTVRWSSDGDYLITSLPSTGDTDQASGDLFCQISTGQCEFLRYQLGNYPCRDASWTTYTQPYEWSFDETAEGWYLIQQLDRLAIENGMLTARSRGATPVISSPKNLDINADTYAYIEITMSVSEGTFGEFNFVTDENPMLTFHRLFTFDLIPDGEMHRYVLDLRDYSLWTGSVKYLRFRPVDRGLVDIQIQSIRILPALEGGN